MILVVGSQLGMRRHRSQVVADVIAIPIGQPDIVADIAVLPVRIDGVRSPVKTADGLVLTRVVAGRFAVPEFHRGVPRGVAVSRHPVDGLLVDRGDAPLLVLVIGEFLVAPRQDPGGQLFPARIETGVVQKIHGHGVAIDFRVRVGGSGDVLEERPPLVSLQRVLLQPLGNDSDGLSVGCLVASAKLLQGLQKVEGAGPIGRVTRPRRLSLLGNGVHRAGGRFDPEGPWRVVGIAGLARAS